MIDLTTIISKLTLKNPILTASGTCGYGHEYSPLMDLSTLGGFTTKSVTVRPRKGNEPHRIVETPSGMLNAIGLANVGLEEFCTTKVKALAGFGTHVFVNVAGHSIDDYVQVCSRVDGLPEISGIELNVSCPNVADGMTFGTDPKLLSELLSAVRPVVRKGILIVKLSPNVTDITQTAEAAIAGGADALSMVNTFVGMVVDIERRKPVLANATGGLSGPAIRPLAINLVHRVYRDVARDAGVPIIGMGGVTYWHDAIEFMLVGASAVAVGTSLFVNPTTPVQIIEGITAYLRKHGVDRVRDLIGAAVNPT